MLLRLAESMAVFAACLPLFATAADNELPKPPEGKSWKLVWHDEFDGTEIDIMEKPWLDDRVQHTFHWDGYGKHHKSKAKLPDHFLVDYVRVYELVAP